MKNITSEHCAHIDNSDPNTPPVVDNLEQDLKSLSLTSEEKEESVAPSFKETRETAGHGSSGETTEAEAAMKKTKEPRKRSQSHLPMTSIQKQGLVAPIFKVDPDSDEQSSGELTEADVEAFEKKTKVPRKRSRSLITDSLQKTIGPLTPMKLRF